MLSRSCLVRLSPRCFLTLTTDFVVARHAVAKQSTWETGMSLSKIMILIIAIFIVSCSAIAFTTLTHKRNTPTLILDLGEKYKITLPAISETNLYFNSHFDSLLLYPLPACQWITLEVALEKISLTQKNLAHLKLLANEAEEYPIAKLNTAYFQNQNTALISKYVFNHYTIAFYMHKLTDPPVKKYLYEDYFQLFIQVERNI